MLSRVMDVIYLVRIKNGINKVQLNSFAALLFLIPLGFSNFNVIMLFYFLLYQLLIGSYGYLLNSFTDLKQDKITGVNKFFQKFPKSQSKIILILLGITSFAFPFMFNNNTILIGLLTFFLATAYSLKPLNLKKRGILGIISSGLAQSALPLLFLASLTTFNLTAVYFALWLFLRQGIEEIEHQEKHYNWDKKTKTKTLLVKVGLKNANKHMKGFYVLFVITTLWPLTWMNLYGLLVSSMLFLLMIHDIKRISKRF